MVCLVMVSLGITLANVVRPRSSGERALAGSGAAVNFFFGTFVEASYPFMFSDRRVFATAIGAATVGGAVVGAMGVEATAYLPAPRSQGFRPDRTPGSRVPSGAPVPSALPVPPRVVPGALHPVEVVQPPTCAPGHKDNHVHHGGAKLTTRRGHVPPSPLSYPAHRDLRHRP